MVISIPAGINLLTKRKNQCRMRMGKRNAFSFRALRLQGWRMIQEGQLRATTSVRLRLKREMGLETCLTWFS